MGRLIRQYSILISCPGDVLEELNVIKQVIENFNKTIGEANNVNLAVKHWSTHVYPESGGKAQELINKQMVLDCDAAIAVFWTRFGTPTDNYGSGTEEEIELLLKENKQVFLYFSNKPLPPKDMISEQYTRVKEFQNEYKEKGIYSEYNSIDEFRQNFTNHLNFHFLKKISEDDPLSTYTKTPSLNIRGIKKDDITEKPKIIQPNLQESRFIEEKNWEINELFSSIKSIEISFEEEKEQEKATEDNNGLLVSDSLKEIGEVTSRLNKKSNPFQSIFGNREIHFLEEEKELVRNYASNKHISMDETVFFNIGHLNEIKNMFGGGPFGTSPSYQLNGSEEEVEKYKLINKLILKIDQFNQWKKYFKEIDSKHFIRLAVSNNGTTFDEDVDIKLFIKKNKLVRKGDLPVPGIGILETATELLESIYKINQTYSIEEYVGSQVANHSNIPNISIPGLGYQESIEGLKENFKENIEDIFVYDYYQDSGFDIISFNISYIKQHTNIGFPTLLVFHSKVKEIKFEVNSKHSAEVIEGMLEIDSIN